MHSRFLNGLSFIVAVYCSGLVALCILLRRLAFPIQYCDRVPRFGRSVPHLCKFTHVVLNHIFAFHRHRIENLNHPWFQPHKLAEYSTPSHDKGTLLTVLVLSMGLFIRFAVQVKTREVFTMGINVCIA